MINNYSFKSCVFWNDFIFIMYPLSLIFGNKSFILVIAIQLNRLFVYFKVTGFVSAYAVFFCSFYALSSEIYVLSVHVNPLKVTQAPLK